MPSRAAHSQYGTARHRICSAFRLEVPTRSRAWAERAKAASLLPILVATTTWTEAEEQLAAVSTIVLTHQHPAPSSHLSASMTSLQACFQPVRSPPQQSARMGTWVEILSGVRTRSTQILRSCEHFGYRNRSNSRFALKPLMS